MKVGKFTQVDERAGEVRIVKDGKPRGISREHLEGAGIVLAGLVVVGAVARVITRVRHPENISLPPANHD